MDGKDIHVVISYGELFAYISWFTSATVAALIALVKIISAQFNRSLEQRFEILNQNKESSQKHLDMRFDGIEASLREEKKGWQQIERDLMTLKADLPDKYVRREDFIRNQSVIESKLDGLALRIENTVLKGPHHG